MLTTRNQPGVNTCVDCRAEKVGCYSWTTTDNSDGIGFQVMATTHLCAACLLKYGQRLAEREAAEPFMESMRHKLEQAGINVPPKARYEEILELYKTENLAPVVQPTLVEPIPEPRQPTIPELRRMPKEELQAVVVRYGLTIDVATRQELIEELIRYFETVAGNAA